MDATRAGQVLLNRGWGWGGDLFVTFLLILRICLPSGLFYMPYAIKKLKIFFLKKNVMFYLRYQGSEKIVKTHYKPINLIHCTGLFDISNEAFWCTDYNAKNPALCEVLFIKKSRKTAKKIGTFEEWSFWAMLFIFWVIMVFYHFSDPW